MKFKKVQTTKTLRGRLSGQNGIRLLIGIFLMLASLLGTLFLVGSLDSTIKIYAASKLLLPGEKLKPTELVIVEVRLEQLSGRYLEVIPANNRAAGEENQIATSTQNLEQYVIERVIGEGELIPLSALSTRGQGNTSLVLPLATELSAQLAPGQLVDIWATGNSRDEFSLPPRILVSRAVIARLPDTEGLLSSQANLRVEVLLPQSVIARVLAAINSGEALSVVQADYR